MRRYDPISNLGRPFGALCIAISLLQGKVWADDWTTGTSGAITAPSSSVAIGTSSTTSRLNVEASNFRALTLSTSNNDSHVSLTGKATNSGNFVLNSHGGQSGFIFGSGDPTSTGYGTGLIWILSDGKVGIGTSSPSDKLTVSGDVKITGALKIGPNGWSIAAPDYVFEKDYELQNLEAVENFIAKNKHLPEIPSASEMNEKGMNLAEMNLRLLKKIEELTLHAIRQEKRIQKLEKQVIAAVPRESATKAKADKTINSLRAKQ